MGALDTYKGIKGSGKRRIWFVENAKPLTEYVSSSHDPKTGNFLAELEWIESKY